MRFGSAKTKFHRFAHEAIHEHHELFLEFRAENLHGMVHKILHLTLGCITAMDISQAMTGKTCDYTFEHIYLAEYLVAAHAEKEESIFQCLKAHQ